MLDSVGAIKYLSWGEYGHNEEKGDVVVGGTGAGAGGGKEGQQLVVVLDPKWLTVLLTTIITFRHGFVRSGVISKSNLFSLWQNHFDESLFGDLARLLEHLDVLLALNKEEFLVPCLLPDCCPES
jgi:C-terminal of Roc, COR, domain